MNSLIGYDVWLERPYQFAYEQDDLEELKESQEKRLEGELDVYMEK
jgi:hypothetical protein